MENKHKGITLVIAIIAAASLLSLGAVAAPAYAGGYGGNGNGVKQKAEAEVECDQKNKVVDGTGNIQTNTQPLCAAISANINDFELLPILEEFPPGPPGPPGLESSSEPEEFSAPSTP